MTDWGESEWIALCQYSHNIYFNGIYVKPIYQTEDLPYIINDTINFSAR